MQPIEFQARLKAPGSFVYAKVRLKAKDGVTGSKTGWIACDAGDRPPAKHGANEWIVYRKAMVGRLGFIRPLSARRDSKLVLRLGRRPRIQ
jgi:hypothetical protein